MNIRSHCVVQGFLPDHTIMTAYSCLAVFHSNILPITGPWLWLAKSIALTTHFPWKNKRVVTVCYAIFSQDLHGNQLASTTLNVFIFFCYLLLSLNDLGSLLLHSSPHLLLSIWRRSAGHVKVIFTRAKRSMEARRCAIFSKYYPYGQRSAKTSTYLAKWYWKWHHSLWNKKVQATFSANLHSKC